MAVNKVNLICNYEDGSGTPVQQGKVAFTPTAVVYDTSTDHLILTQTPIVVDLSLTPSPTVQLIATDNANMAPAGWSWAVSPQFQGAPPGQQFSIPYTSGATQYLSDLLPTVTSPVEPTGGTYTGTVVLDGTPPMTIPAGAASGKVLSSDDEGNVSWVAEPAGTAYIVTPTTVKTGNYTAAASDYVRCDSTSAAFTVTLPTAPANGTVIGFKLIASATPLNKVTVACGGSDVLNKAGGSTSMQMIALNQGFMLQYVSSGAIWLVTDEDPALSVPARYGEYLLDSFTGTDDQKMTAALAAAFAASPPGGTIVLGPRAHTFASQWTTTYSAGVATGVKIKGAGVAYNGRWTAPSGATTCAFTYTGAGTACMDFQHIGSVEMTGIQFISANTGKPLFQTTNATPNLHDNVWSGGGTGANCVTDAIILGGTTSSIGAGDTAAYQGYQGQVYRNFFDGIRRIAVFQTAANSIEIHENTVSTTCGSALFFGGCIEFNDVADSAEGNHIWGNCVEMVHYPCFIRGTSGCQLNTFGPNGLYDATSGTLAYHYFAPAATQFVQFNRIIDGFRNDAFPLVLDAAGGTNTADTFHQSSVSLRRQPEQTYVNVDSTYLGPNGTSPKFQYFNGDFATIGAFTDAPGAGGFASVILASGNCTQVTDGAIFTGSNYLTSLTAAFTTTDVGVPIDATGVAQNFIQRTMTPATAFPWVASTAYRTGDIGRPTSANSHLYQVTTAGTSGSSPPTWPTSGGTVTDGTAVWTDLGTTATAAFLWVPATATSTGLTVKFGRTAATNTVAKFARYHFLSQGGTPTGTADAGAGTAPSGITTTGTDHAFTFAITTGTSPATGAMFHVAPAQAWTGTPKFSMTATDAGGHGAALMAGGYYLTVSGGTVTANFVNAPTAATTYSFSFIAMV